MHRETKITYNKRILKLILDRNEEESVKGSRKQWQCQQTKRMNYNMI